MRKNTSTFLYRKRPQETPSGRQALLKLDPFRASSYYDVIRFALSLTLARGFSPGGAMAETPLYCSECYNTHARANDAQVKAAESAGKVPMTKQGACTKCGKATIVVYYDA